MGRMIPHTGESFPKEKGWTEPVWEPQGSPRSPEMSIQGVDIDPEDIGRSALRGLTNVPVGLAALADLAVNAEAPYFKGLGAAYNFAQGNELDAPTNMAGDMQSLFGDHATLYYSLGNLLAASPIITRVDGEDSIVGGSGHDALVGGGGKDDLSGGPGADVIMGDLAKLAWSGELLEFVLSQTPEIGDQDLVVGGDGADLISGQGGDDDLSGDDGGDYIFGELESFGLEVIKHRFEFTDFFDKLDPGVFRRARHEFADEIKRVAELANANAGDFVLQMGLFKHLIAPSETMFRFGPPGTIASSDPVRTLDELFNRYVHHDFDQREEAETTIKRRLNTLLKEQFADRVYREERLGDELYHVTFPFVWRHNEHTPLQAIRPLSFDLDDPKSILDKGHRKYIRWKRKRR